MKIIIVVYQTAKNGDAMGSRAVRLSRCNGGVLNTTLTRTRSAA